MSKQCHLWVILGCSLLDGVLFLPLDFLKPAGWLCWIHKDSNCERRNVGWATWDPIPVNSKKSWLVRWAGCSCPIAVFLLLMALGKQVCLGISRKRKRSLLLSPFSKGLEEQDDVAAAQASSCNHWRCRKGFPSEIALTHALLQVFTLLGPKSSRF